ncbi:hypothetical protein [Paraburkholderia graminis]|uniref:hypothetical protein n=1 Tax=Paraburkholderia graminis TaxID=60548 RepID=UPI0038BB5DFC
MDTMLARGDYKRPINGALPVDHLAEAQKHTDAIASREYRNSIPLPNVDVQEEGAAEPDAESTDSAA